MSQSLRIDDFVNPTPDHNPSSAGSLNKGKPVSVSPQGDGSPEARVNAHELSDLLSRVKDERFKLMRSLKSAKARRDAADDIHENYESRFQSLLQQAEHLEAVVAQRSSDLGRLQDDIDRRLEQLAEIEGRIESAASRFSRLLTQATAAEQDARVFEEKFKATQKQLATEAVRRFNESTDALKAVDAQAKASIIDFAERARELMQMDLPAAVAENMGHRAAKLVNDAVGAADDRVRRARDNAEALSEQIAEQLTGRVKKSIAQAVAQQQHKADGELRRLVQEVDELINQARDSSSRSVGQAVQKAVESALEQTREVLSDSGAAHVQAVQQRLRAEIENAEAQAKKLGQRQTAKTTAQLRERLGEVLDAATEKADGSIDQFRDRLKESLKQTIQDANATASMMQKKVERLGQRADEIAAQASDQVASQIQARVDEAFDHSAIDVEPIRERIEQQAQAFSQLIETQTQHVSAAVQGAQAPAEAKVQALSQTLTAQIDAAVAEAEQKIAQGLSGLDPQAKKQIESAQQAVREEVKNMTESAQAMMQMTDRKLQKKIQALGEAADAAENAEATGSASIDEDALRRVKNQMQAAFDEHKEMLRQDMSMMTDMIQKVVLKR